MGSAYSAYVWKRKNNVGEEGMCGGGSNRDLRCIFSAGNKENITKKVIP